MEKMDEPKALFELSHEQLTWNPDKKIVLDSTDISLVVDQHVFNVHKHILEASSDYFKAMFSSGMCESDKHTIHLKLIQHQPFQSIVESFYSGKLKLNRNNIFQVTETAHMLQLTPVLFSQCTEFLQHLINPQSCFSVMHFSDSINLVEIFSDARKYCLANFCHLRHCQSFYDLTLSQMFDYLSNKYLVVIEEIHVFEAIRTWFTKNESARETISLNSVKRIISGSICLKNGRKSVDALTDMVLDEGKEFAIEDAISFLSTREMQEDVFMFWSLLNSTAADGLVDIVKLCQETGQGIKVGSMTDVVEQPGYDLGSAFCVHGCCVYLSGGGPSFGKVNWIRKIYKFDLSKTSSFWEPMGDLYEMRRYHAMVAIGQKLYIFGGFGKFRTKNVKLDCFDIVSGAWESLPVAPTHEIKPVATSDQQRIYYMDRSYTVHCFNTLTGHWCSLTTTLPSLCTRANPPPPPVAIFTVKEKPGSLLAVLNGADAFSLLTLKVQEQDGEQDYTVSDNSEVRKDGSYEGSALANNELFLLVGHRDVDDVEYKDPGQFAAVKQVLAYCTKSKTTRTVEETNVKKALAFVTVPHMPPSFSTGALRPGTFEDLE